jgi:hypothetical protein
MEAARTPATTKRTQFFTVSIKTSGKLLIQRLPPRSVPFFGEQIQKSTHPSKNAPHFDRFYGRKGCLVNPTAKEHPKLLLQQTVVNCYSFLKFV